jgi:hypothetical protein
MPAPKTARCQNRPGRSTHRSGLESSWNDVTCAARASGRRGAELPTARYWRAVPGGPDRPWCSLGPVLYRYRPACGTRPLEDRGTGQRTGTGTGRRTAVVTAGTARTARTAVLARYRPPVPRVAGPVPAPATSSWAGHRSPKGLRGSGALTNRPPTTVSPVNLTCPRRAAAGLGDWGQSPLPGCRRGFVHARRRCGHGWVGRPNGPNRRSLTCANPSCARTAPPAGRPAGRRRLGSTVNPRLSCTQPANHGRV